MHKNRYAIFTTGILLFCAPLLVAAQEQTNDKAVGPEFEEIVVTAQKRTQNLQDVSASIAALTGKRLRETRANSFADYISSVASLSAVEAGPGLTTLAIRGVTTGGVRNDEPQNKETVGVYLDETPVSVNGFNPDLGLYDIERIEVLRGPQGTLYGSGSLGGTIRIITNKPNFTEFGGRFDSAVSSTDHGGTNYDVKGMINAPLVAGSLAVRAVAYHTMQDGYIDNIVTGAENVNDATTSGARIQIGAQLSDNLDANLTYVIHDLETGSRSEQNGPFVFTTRAFDGLDSSDKIYNLTLNLDLGWALLTSSSSYFDKETLNRNTTETLVLAALGLDSPAPLVDTTAAEDFTQELRIASVGDGPYTWVIGGFYQDRARDLTQNVIIPGLDAWVMAPSVVFGAPAPDTGFFGTQNIDQKQFALFGELGYTFPSGIAVTAGLRYFDFDEDYATFSSGLFNGGVTSDVGNVSDDGFTPKVNLSYKPNDDALIYAQIAKGFRLGGVNTSVPTGICDADLAALGRTSAADRFDADTAMNYEIGAKNSFLDRRLTINSSIYYIDWSDIQTSLDLPSCNFAFRTNAGSARSIGAEVETDWRIADDLDFYASLGFTESELSDNVPFTSWEKGDRVPGVPRIQASTGLRKAFSIGNSDAYARFDYRYVGDIDNSFDTQSSDNRSYGDYHLVDIRFGTNVLDSAFNVSIFVSNVTNSTDRVSASADSFGGPDNFITVLPRTFGISFDAAF